MDRETIHMAVVMLERAGAMRRPGPYQLQAAIIACHAEAPSWEATDWTQIVLLYDALIRIEPAPIARLNRAVAIRQVHGPEAALHEIEALADALRGYRLFHATKAELLRGLGRHIEARAEDAVALSLTANPAERELLLSRLAAADTA